MRSSFQMKITTPTWTHPTTPVVALYKYIFSDIDASLHIDLNVSLKGMTLANCDPNPFPCVGSEIATN